MATRYRKCKNIFTKHFPGVSTLYIRYNTVTSIVEIFDEQFKLLDWYSSFWDDAEDEGWGNTNNTDFHYELDDYLGPIYDNCFIDQTFLSEEEKKQFPSI